MKYCQHCGAAVSGHDRFCAECGKALFTNKSTMKTRNTFYEEPKEKLFCELAYSGFGFFLPLLIETPGIPGRKRYLDGF